MTSYACTVIDPNWAEYGGGSRGAQNHYALLKTPEIAKLILRSPAWRPADNAHLWCWVTDNFMLDGLSLIEQLGFTYKRTFCWVKMADRAAAPIEIEYAKFALLPKLAADALQIGLGQYARGAHELCLFSTRGDAMVPEPSSRPPSVLFAPRREHSRKPDECLLQWFERVSPGPRLEMFARSRRPGWDSWGDETTKFDATQQAEVTAGK